MKTLTTNLRVLFSGDTVLVCFSTLLFLSASANATQWRILQGFRFCGVCVMLLSTAFCLLTGIEVFKPERRKRTIIAAILFLAATIACFSGMHITIERG